MGNTGSLITLILVAGVIYGVYYLSGHEAVYYCYWRLGVSYVENYTVDLGLKSFYLWKDKYLVVRGSNATYHLPYWVFSHDPDMFLKGEPFYLIVLDRCDLKNVEKGAEVQVPDGYIVKQLKYGIGNRTFVLPVFAANSTNIVIVDELVMDG